jgi:hypothetical protein
VELGTFIRHLALSRREQAIVPHQRMFNLDGFGMPKTDISRVNSSLLAGRWPIVGAVGLIAASMVFQPLAPLGIGMASASSVAHAP